METKIFNKMGPRQKLVYFSLFLVVVIAAAFFFVIKPAAEDMKGIKNDIKKERAELERKYLEGLNAKLISKKADRIRGDLEVLDRIFIEEDGYLDLVTSLERIAADNKVEEKLDILEDSAQNKKEHRVVPVHIEVEGEFKNLLAFVYDLKRAPFQFNINKLKIRSESPDSAEVLRQRSYQDAERVSNKEIIRIDDKTEATTTTSTREEIVIQKTPTSTPEVKDVSIMVLGEVYWEK